MNDKIETEIIGLEYIEDSFARQWIIATVRMDVNNGESITLGTAKLANK